MKNRAAPLSRHVLEEARNVGACLRRLRAACGVKQQFIASGARLSRNTAYRIEKGDPGVAIGHILRYLETIMQSMTLLELLGEKDLVLDVMRERVQRTKSGDFHKEELNDWYS